MWKNKERNSSKLDRKQDLPLKPGTGSLKETLGAFFSSFFHLFTIFCFFRLRERRDCSLICQLSKLLKRIGIGKSSFRKLWLKYWRVSRSLVSLMRLIMNSTSLWSSIRCLKKKYNLYCRNQEPKSKLYS